MSDKPVVLQPSNHPAPKPAPTTSPNGVHFANFVPHGLPRFWMHFKVGARHFARDYKLPLIATLIFIALIIGAVGYRAAQRSSLANLLEGVSSKDQDYGTLLSNDKTDELKKNTNNDLPAATGQTSNTNSLTVNTGSSSGNSTTTPPTAGGGGGGTTTPPAQFTASISYFRQDSVTLECANPNNPKIQNCSKKYTFSAGIRSQNGPGTVNYGWRSSMQSAIGDASVSVASGEVVTNVQKVITLACSNVMAFSLQFQIASPSSAQSNTINTIHNCVGI